MPRKPRLDQAAQTRVTIRLTDQEFVAAKRLAQLDGANISDLIRRLLAVEAARAEETRNRAQAEAESRRRAERNRRSREQRARRRREEGDHRQREEEARRQREEQRSKAGGGSADSSDATRRQARRRDFPWLPHDELDLLGLEWPCTEAEVRKAQRKAALNHHPDLGGDLRQMQAINAAAAQILQILGSGG